MKVLLKKDALKKLERRLEAAIRMLTLAQQSYLVALTRVQPDIIVHKFAVLTAQRSQPKSQLVRYVSTEKNERDSSDSAETHTNQAGVIRHDRWSYRGFRKPSIFGTFQVGSSSTWGQTVLLQAPAWLSQRSWELHATRAKGAWQLNLRTYSIVPKDSEVMRLAGNGSVEEMQMLFDAGQASPFDQDERGLTLLHQATLSESFVMAKYLISTGLRPVQYLDPEKISPVEFIEFIASPSARLSWIEQTLDDPFFAKNLLVFRVSSYFDAEDDGAQMPQPRCFCKWFIHDFKNYKAVLPYQCPQHQVTSLESRLKAASSATNNGLQCSLQVVKYLMEPEWTTKPRSVCCYNTSYPLIWSAFRGLCSSTGLRSKFKIYQSKPPVANSSETSSDRVTFLASVIRHTDMEIYEYKNIYKGSTLMCALYTIAIAVARRIKLPHIHHQRPALILKLWLRALQLGGIHLNRYGQRESDIIADTCALRRVEVDEWSDTYMWSVYVSIYLISFKFGPEPEDWKFYFDESTDEFTGDFWRLIEDPPLCIPGSWVN
ncbi:uncharacterized protein F4822DRAFT_434129 [Hypoxylon trugodes]|uniref:uncharacterized protein n=1 Tax=Hypoxylon trugodes TaxID=326681 RepID=UPI00219CE3C2|nr:uncharacterized protein F4822DRAFT_434129 [Hypoxylon trugodes]KAI1384189.1 hypothetical protein F4822DRAFT_434129 [Hypoxylon trugodes]